MQAKFSLGTVRPQQPSSAVWPEELAKRILTRPDVVDLRDRVKVVTDPALGKQDADVEITLASGRSLSTQVRGNRGTPSAPLDDDELDTKFRELVGPVLGAERAERLLATCWRLDELTDVSELLAQTVPRWLPINPTSRWSPAQVAAWEPSSPNALPPKALRWRSTPGAHRARRRRGGAIRAGGGCAFSVTANVTDPSAVRRMFDDHRRAWPVAGPRQQRVVPSPAASRDDHRRRLASGPLGHPRRRIPLYPVCAAPLIPGGRIVNILGRNALAGDPERVHLSAAKHGLLGLTLALAAALRDDGVAVNAVSPGVDTDGPEWIGAGPKSLLRWHVWPSQTQRN